MSRCDFRLAVLFLLLLSTAVLLCSLSSWGITYAASQACVASMAEGFADLAQSTVESFGDLVDKLIADSAAVLDAIVEKDTALSGARIDQTAAQVDNTTLELLSFARQISRWSHTDLESLVASFGGFMANVTDSFATTADTYASRMRYEMAAKVQVAFEGLLQERIKAVQRPAYQHALGLMPMNRDPAAPLTRQDCLTLALVCATSREVSLASRIGLGTSTGADYVCDASAVAGIYAIFPNSSGGVDKVMLTWSAPANETLPPEDASFQWLNRCLTEEPQYEAYGVNCSHDAPGDSGCGFDPRRRLWYLSQVDAVGPPKPRMTGPFSTLLPPNSMGLTLTYPIYNTTNEPRALLGVASVEFYFFRLDEFLGTIATPVPSRTAVILNNSNLTIMGDSLGMENSTNCSDIAAIRVCDPVLGALGLWLAENRGTVGAHASVRLDGIVWDVFGSALDTFGYFVVVGMAEGDIYGVINASRALAATDLAALLDEHTEYLMVLDNASEANMQAVKATNLQQLAVMREQLVSEAAEGRHLSQAALNASQAAGAAHLHTLIAAQNHSIKLLEAANLQVLAAHVGWTMAVVVAVLVGTLVAGVLATMSVTNSLQRLIKAMEDVAEMRVEALQVTPDSYVLEVHRIQSVFQKLVRQLSHYKSFIPAGLFQGPTSQNPFDEEAIHRVCSVSYGLQSTSATALRDQGEQNFHAIVGASTVSPSPPAGPVPLQVPSPPTSVRCPKVGKRNVAGVVVNVVDFHSLAFTAAADAIESAMNQYVSIVHGVIAQAKGNVDCVVGDQILVTFNAHIPCPDPINAAVRAALELSAAFSTRGTFRLKTQIGMASGVMFAGSSGYEPYKTLVALGAPLKVAALLAHLTPLGTPHAVLADPSIEERARYTYDLRPMDLVALPSLGQHAPRFAKGVRVYHVRGPKHLPEGEEWMYQIASTTNEPADWESTFDSVAAAESVGAARAILEGYLVGHPKDPYALRLMGRMGRWRPRAGVLLSEGPEPQCDVAMLGDSTLGVPDSFRL